MRLIDADALIESMGVSDAVKWGNKDRYQQAKSYSTIMCYEIKGYIDSQPTVDAVPVVHGRWKNGHCSCCGEDVAGVLDTWMNVQNLLYCPNCGAKMDLEEQNA